MQKRSVRSSGGLDLRRREREVGAAQAHPRCALVRQRVGHVEFDARMLAMEPGEQRRQPAGGQRRQHRNRDASAPPRHVIAEVGQRRLGVVQQAPRRVDEHVALGGELDAARRPFEEARADLLFERADQRGEGGLRQVVGGGRARKALLLDEGDEGAQRTGGDIDLHIRSMYLNFGFHRSTPSA